MARLTDKIYSVFDCYNACKETDKCASFIVNTGTVNDGICSLYAAGCENHENSFPYYPAYETAVCDEAFSVLRK